MIIKRIEIDGFGKFSKRTFDFGSGFNLIKGDNEDGKTTLMSFVKMMFYSSSSKTEKATDLFKSLRKKYRPWNGDKMAGAIEFESEGMEYRLQKEFLKSEATDKTIILCKTTGETLSIENKNDAGEHFFGMTLDEFERSVFIGSPGGFSADSAADSLAMRISNLSVSGDENISHEQILKRLSDALEELVSKSRKKGMLVEEEAHLDELFLERQALEHMENDQRELQLEIAVLENETQQLEDTLNAISDGQRIDSARKELNGYYTLHNKLNLLNTVKNQLTNYDAPESTLREYIEKAQSQMSEIEKSLSLIQEATAASAAAKVTDSEYARLSALDEKLQSLKHDLELLQGRIKKFEEELNQKTKKAIKSAQMLPILLFAVLAAVGGTMSIFIKFLWLIPVAVGFVCLAILLPTAKKRAEATVSVQLAKRDFEAALRELSIFNDAMLSTPVANLEAEFNSQFEKISSELNTGLATYGCNSIDTLKRLSASAQAEDIKAISEKLNIQKEQFIALANTIKPCPTYPSAKILYVELAESLNSFEALTAEIDSICTATGIEDRSAEHVDNQIKSLGELIKNAPSVQNTDKSTIEELRKELKQKRNRLGECQSRITVPKRSIGEVDELISKSQSRISELQNRYRSLDIALIAMNEAILDTNKGLGSTLSQKVGKYLSNLTDNRYKDVIVPRDLSLETRTDEASVYHEWKYLSSAAIDRVYLALRLAVTDILTKDKTALALFFDDILAQYDDKSTGLALEFLNEYLNTSGSVSQIMFFTCHNHIADRAKNIFDKVNEISL